MDRSMSRQLFKTGSTNTPSPPFFQKFGEGVLFYTQNLSQLIIQEYSLDSSYYIICIML